MGFLDKAFKKIQAEAEKALEEHLNNSKKNEGSKNDGIDGIGTIPCQISSGSSTSSSISSISVTMSEVLHYGANATRWEKAVVATNAIVGEVISFDPDGVDVVVVGGQKAKTSDESTADSTEKDDVTWHSNIKDSTGLEDTITQRSPGGSCPLGAAMEDVLTKALDRDLVETPCSVLVLTAGKPDDSETLQNSLRNASQAVASRGGIEKCPLSITFIQIGTDKDASEYLKFLDKKMVGISEATNEKVDIVDTMDYEELQQTMQNMREHNTEMEQKAKQKGKAGVILGGVAGAAIGIGGMYLYGKNKAGEKNKKNWAGYLGAAAAGAAALGATGYAIDKKFFRKVGDNENGDYVLILDRSAKMDPTDDEQEE